MTDVRIRPVNVNDHHAWLPLWQAYLRFYNTELAEGVSAITWQRLVDANEPTHSALAWRGDEAVGMVNFIYHRSNWSINNACYLQDLIVAPENADRHRQATDRVCLRHGQGRRLRQGALADPRNQRHGHSVVRANRRTARPHTIS